MKKHLKKLYEIRFLMLILVTSIAVGFGIFSIIGFYKSENMLKKQSNMIDSLQHDNEFYLKLKAADEYYIFEKDYNKTLGAYNMLLPDQDEEKIQLIKKRISRMEMLKALPDSSAKIEFALQQYDLIVSRNNRVIDSLMIENKKLKKDETNSDSLVNKIERLKIELSKMNTELNRKQLIQTITFKSENGKTIHYMGEVVNGKANGGGVGVWSTGSIYRGDWKDNKRHGKGKFEWADGVKYVGEYKEDKRDGEGIYSWPSGERYEGEWKKDMREGYGVHYDQDGNIKFKGIWKEDKIFK